MTPYQYVGASPSRASQAPAGRNFTTVSDVSRRRSTSSSAVNHGMPERNSPAEGEEATPVASHLMPTTVESALTRRLIAPAVEDEQGAGRAGIAAPRQLRF